MLVNKTTGEILAEEVEIADSFWTRFRGLMFRRSFEFGNAILFEIPTPRKFGIHTFFVFFPIDLIYLDEDFDVLELKKDLPSWRFYSPSVKSKYLIELPGGKLRNSDVNVGDRLGLRD